jgi:hypothetical protein
MINTNILLIIIIDFPFTYILDYLNIFNFTSYTLTSIILLSGISFYIFKGVKRGLKILVPVAGIVITNSQTYLNHFQIQEFKNSRISDKTNNDKTNNNKPKS